MSETTHNYIFPKRTAEQLDHQLSGAASMVKLACGVGNNAAYAVMLTAHDHIKMHPNYRHEVKRLYRQAFTMFRQREGQLLHRTTNRFFHVADMTPEVRKKYGNITDAQYFEFWQGLGALAYREGQPLITSLHNKYRLSLLGHGIALPDIVAWPMTAQACLELACTLYNAAVRSCAEEYHLPIGPLRDLFAPFSLRPVADVWNKALTLTDPKADTYDLNEGEKRNIQLGLEQLEELWANPKFLYNSAFTATEDFEDIFRTKGENKKALREIGEIMQETEERM